MAADKADLRCSLFSRQGAQGTYDEASNAEKENEFGTKVDDEVIEKILASGTLQESSVSQCHLPILGDSEQLLTPLFSMNSSPSAKAPRTILRVPSLPTRGSQKEGEYPNVRQELCSKSTSPNIITSQLGSNSGHIVVAADHTMAIVRESVARLTHPYVL